MKLEIVTKELVLVSALSVIAFLIAMALTVVYTNAAYKYKFWKKQRTVSTSGEKLEVFTKLHAKKFRHNIPTMAGIVGVSAAAIVTFGLNLDRGQTWLPLAALIGGGLIGLIDDIINIRGDGSGVAGLRSSLKFMMLTALALALGWFFYDKLGYTTVLIPDMIARYFEISPVINLGWFIIPLFVLAVVSTGNAVNISDGLDGLAGGMLTTSFGTFGVIALMQGNEGIAGFCFTIVGVLLAYLWFNIHPARFFMGDVGSFAYGTALGVVAMLTNTLFLLPIIGILFVVEAGSSLLQLTSKKLFKRKIFKSAPLHHHLEANGWPEEKVTMRFWVISCVAAFLGIVLALGGGYVI
ncbi:phospho-N-acetylmuramoyl-pentapeptide-transferase [Candidatus Saccharibacteria bacterium]|nr:phospho-N-acetylmuramoyl-pentapeptide-transferase [Candidatus Saccharibacteria bacterium]